MNPELINTKSILSELSMLNMELNSQYGEYGYVGPSLEKQKIIKDRINQLNIELSEHVNMSLLEFRCSDKENQYRVELIAELINIIEHPENSSIEWKNAVIDNAREKGYGEY